MDTPNSVEDSQVDANANPQDDFNRTEESQAPAESIDYKEKFSASSRESLRLLEEKKALEARVQELEQGNSSESLYPGFEELDEDAQRNLIEYTKSVEAGVLKSINNDPAISFARQSYNENKFSTAFSKVLDQFPELKDSKEEFKIKYFQPNNVPDNIEDVLSDLAKVHLFDKAMDMGASDEKTRSERIDLERAHAGEKPTNISSRTLEEWSRLAQENPAKFAALSKEYQTDLDSGKLKE